MVIKAKLRYNKRKGGGYKWQDQKRYTINLTDEELKEVKSVIHKKNISQMIRSRRQIFIGLDEACLLYTSRCV